MHPIHTATIINGARTYDCENCMQAVCNAMSLWKITPRSFPHISPAKDFSVGPWLRLLQAISLIISLSLSSQWDYAMRFCFGEKKKWTEFRWRCPASFSLHYMPVDQRFTMQRNGFHSNKWKCRSLTSACRLKKDENIKTDHRWSGQLLNVQNRSAVQSAEQNWKIKKYVVLPQKKKNKKNDAQTSVHLDLEQLRSMAQKMKCHRAPSSERRTDENELPNAIRSRRKRVETSCARNAYIRTLCVDGECKPHAVVVFIYSINVSKIELAFYF